MSVSKLVDKLKISMHALSQLPMYELENSSTGIGEWDGPSYPEFVIRVSQLLKDIEKTVNFQPLDLLPFPLLRALDKGVLETSASIQQFVKSRTAENFMLAAQNTDSLAYLLLTNGLAYPGHGLPSLHAAVQEIEPELRRLKEATTDANSLKVSLRSLITPTVSNELSKAFNTRGGKVRVARIVWACMAAACVLIAIGVTVWSLSEINRAIIERFRLIELGKQISSGTDVLLLTEVGLRSAILIPLYTSVAICFGQYKRERDFEEEYAHKAAVAATIPGYGEIVRNDEVRDQIVSGASTVIFSSPTQSSKDAKSSSTPPESLKGISEVIDSVAKLVPKKD